MLVGLGDLERPSQFWRTRSTHWIPGTFRTLCPLTLLVEEFVKVILLLYWEREDCWEAK